MPNRVFRLRYLAVALGAVAIADACSGNEAFLTCRAALDCNHISDNVTINIPAAAIPNGLALRAIRQSSPPASATMIGGSAWLVQPEATVFNPRATLILRIAAESLAAVTGVQASELGLYRHNGSAWVAIDSQTVDAGQLQITARIGALGLFAVMGAPVASVTVTPGADTVAVAGTTQLTAAVRDAANNVLPQRGLTWSSSANAVATVSGTGLVTGVSAGTATITATSSGFNGTATITVIPATACGSTGVGATIASVSRTGGSTLGGTTVRITGSGFQASDCVFFGATQAAIGFINTATIDAVVPAATAAGPVSVRVVQNGVTATLSNGWTYYPAPTTLYASHDFDDGTLGPFSAPAPTTSSTDMPFAGTRSARTLLANGYAGTGATGSFTRTSGTYNTTGNLIGDDVYLFDAAGNRIGIFQVTSNTATTLSFTGDATGAVTAYGPPYQTGSPALTYNFAAPNQNPAFNDPNGLYQRWYIHIPSATLVHINGVNLQIKLHLLRIGNSQPGHLMVGIGRDFAYAGRSDLLQFNGDNGVFLLPGGRPGTTFGDGVWHEIQLWSRRDVGMGYARVWLNGRLIVDVQDTRLGSEVSTDAYRTYIGVAYTQNGGPILTYVDNVSLANGYIDP